MEQEKQLVIAIKSDVKKGLDRLKIHPRETYNQVIERLIKIAKEQGYVPVTLSSNEEIENELSKELSKIPLFK